jgi:hypothetical protein
MLNQLLNSHHYNIRTSDVIEMAVSMTRHHSTCTNISLIQIEVNDGLSVVKAK